MTKLQMFVYKCVDDSIVIWFRRNTRTRSGNILIGSAYKHIARVYAYGVQV